MLREISNTQFNEWKTLYNSDPWGEQRADLRIGMLDAIVCSALSKKKFKATDFMLFQEEQPKTFKEEQAELRKNIKAYNRKVKGIK